MLHVHKPSRLISAAFASAAIAVVVFIPATPGSATSVSTGRVLDSFSWITATWDQNVLHLTLSDVKAGEYEVSELDNPPRVVIDVPSRKSTGNRPVQSSFDFSGGLLTQLRASATPDGSRVVLESRYQLYWELPQDTSAENLDLTFLLRFRQTVEEKAIDDGTTYVARRYVTPSGQRFTHAVVSDPARSHLKPRVFFASDVANRQIAGVRDIAQGSRSAVAINGGFFTWPGISLSLVIQNGAIMAPPQLHRPAFMVLEDGSYRMDYPIVHARISSAYGIDWVADVVNQRPGPGHIALLTPGHPGRLRDDMTGTMAVIRDNIVEYVTDGEIEDFSDRTILWARRQYPPLELLRPGEMIDISYYLDQSSPPIAYAIQGGPFLLRNGRVQITSAQDDIGNDIARGRSARTAVGYDESGKIYLVVVEGSDSPRSMGATLEEMAWTLQDLGATWGMNLDGGSSSAMAFGYSDPETSLPAGRRSVATCLVLIDESGRMQGHEFHF
jgi:hypothetical protein